MTHLEYKGYFGTAELSEEDGVFHGKLAHIRDVVTYESATAKGLVKAFREAVNAYLADCEADQREPDRPYKGQFQVRTRPELHRALARVAMRKGISLNEMITSALETAIEKEEKSVA